MGQYESAYLETLRKSLVESSVGKEENASNRHFLLFPSMFSADAYDLDLSTILSFRKEFKLIVLIF